MVDIFDFLDSISWAIVPSLGAISMQGLAREKQFDDYNSTSTPYTPISLLDLAETFVNFEGTNVNGVNYPNDDKPHAMSEWRGYDHDYGVDCTSITTRTLGRTATLGEDPCSALQRTYYTDTADWQSATQLYSGNINSCTPAPAGFYYEDVNGGPAPVRQWNGTAFIGNFGCP